MAEQKGKRRWWSIPEQAEKGMGEGTKEAFKVVTKTILLAAGVAGWRWVQEHRQEISQGVRHGGSALGSRTKRFANRPMQGLQAGMKKITSASSAKRR